MQTKESREQEDDKPTRLIGIAIEAALARHKWNRTTLAEKTNLTHPTISRLIAGRRPTADILEAVCHAWGNPKTEINILCEHLRDEIRRANRLTEEIMIAPTGANNAGQQDVAKHLDIIRQEAKDNADVRHLIAELANMIERYQAAQPRRYRMVAETQTEYKTKRPKRSKDAPGSDTDPAQPAR